MHPQYQVTGTFKNMNNTESHRTAIFAFPDTMLTT